MILFGLVFFYIFEYCFQSVPLDQLYELHSVIVVVIEKIAHQAGKDSIVTLSAEPSAINKDITEALVYDDMVRINFL